jgi:4-alpha-glucanotransferase
MRILQFAFDARESGIAFDPDNGFLPHNYPEHTVVYTGTHDNDTVRGWWESASAEERAYAMRYMGSVMDEKTNEQGFRRTMPSTHPISETFIREAMKSVASWAVIPMQDILGLGSEARINTPSTLGGNWTWRMARGAFDLSRAAELREMTRLYGRLRS